MTLFPITTRRARAAALVLGALGSLMTGAAAAQAADPCADGVAVLKERIAGLEAGVKAAPTSISPKEIAQLRALLFSALRLGLPTDVPACLEVLGQADRLRQTIAKPQVIDAVQLAKTELRGEDGAVVGSITDLVIDPQAGRVAYAVVTLGGGFLGVGDSQAPVPWALIKPGPDGAYSLPLSKERLSGAPRFSGTQRPDMGDRQWALAIHTYYGVPPYWLQDASAMAALCPAPDAVTSAGGGGKETVAPAADH
jgi:sporulation protein YlmC with PRC-barrel domain